MAIVDDFNKAVDDYILQMGMPPMEIHCNTQDYADLINSLSSMATFKSYTVQACPIFRGCKVVAILSVPHPIACFPYAPPISTATQLPNYPHPDYFCSISSNPPWQPPSCECGADKVGSNLHSRWCPKV